MKKNILGFLMSAVIMSGFSTYAVAEEIVNDVNSQEISQADSAIEDYGEMGKDIEVYAADDKSAEQIFDVSGYDLDNSYKSYAIKGLMIDDYKETKDFDSLITDDYRVYVPADNMFITLYPDDETGELEVVCMEEYDKNYVNIPQQGEFFKETLDEEVIEIKYLDAFTYYLEIIYIKTAENKYVVPYFSGMINDGIAGRIENGKLYMVEEFMQAMDNTFDIENHDPMANGGVPIKPLSNEVVVPNSVKNTETQNSASNNYFLIYTIAAAVLVIGGVSCIYIYEKKHKSKETSAK